ncbi:membrane protein [Pseudomonas putida]|nr:membrane protein [Pseudomonas putida]
MLSVALIGFAGFAALCLAMEKHFSDLLGRKPAIGQLRSLRIAGWSLLLASLLLSVHLGGWAHGLVEWVAVLMAGMTLWVFALPYQPRLLLGLAATSLVLGPLLVISGG